MGRKGKVKRTGNAVSDRPIALHVAENLETWIIRTLPV
jgi:hypothetical protein